MHDQGDLIGIFEVAIVVAEPVDILLRDAEDAARLFLIAPSFAT